MKLQHIITQLSTDEFSQLSIGGQDRGVINEQNYTQVVNHINLGLTALYRRFNLKEGRLQVILQPNQATYRLHSDFAVNNALSREPVRYLQDEAAAPFKDDILKIEQVRTEFGVEMELNTGTPVSVHTPSLISLTAPDIVVHQTSQTPYWLRVERLNVVYRANHPMLQLKAGFIDANRTELELPMSHVEALLYFVASRVNNPIGMSNEFHAGNNYAAKYEAVCRELEAQNLEVDFEQHNYKAQQKGFV